MYFIKKIGILLGISLFLIIILGCSRKYVITFNTNGGNELEIIEKESKEKIYLPTPEKLGYTFDEWYSNEALTEQFTETEMPKKNITLYAKWSINQYIITFNSNGGSNVPAINQDYNTLVLEPNQPTRHGYTFVGWYITEELTTTYTFTTMPAENITLYAKWTINYYI